MMTADVHGAPDPLDAALGADLAGLVRARSVALVRCEEITRVRSIRRKRGAFALELADGTRLKGRRFESAERAHAVEQLRARISDSVAPLIDRRGDAFLLEWVDGAALDSLVPTPLSLIRRCGELLGALHLRTAVDADHEGPDPIDELVAKLERNAATLCAAGILDEGAARNALVTALRHRPARCTHGIILKDFCAENIVLRPDGELVCIDEANLARGPLDLDLARTWCRWPMTPEELESFANGYEVHRPISSFLEHFPFWAASALFTSAASRHRSRAPGVDGYLGRLDEIRERRIDRPSRRSA